MLDHNLVLKSDELFLVGEMSTDGSGERATGLYLRDTRHLNRLDLALNGTRLSALSARTLGAASAVVTSANALLETPEGPIRPHTVSVEQRLELGTELRARVRVRNHGDRSLPLLLDVTAAADFRDLFDIRGFPRARRGRLLEPAVAPDRVTLRYVGLDGVETGSTVAFDRPATIAIVHLPAEPDEQAVLLPGYDQITPRPAPEPPAEVTASFAAVVAPGAAWDLTVTVAPLPAGGVAVSARPTLPDGQPPTPAVAVTDDPFFNRYLERSAADLAMLQTSFPGGSLPAAGIPWYVAPFGRDSLITGLMTVALSPRRAQGTLRVLAAMQGTEVDAWRDEEPGKILHEVRFGEMGRLREIPHTPYFGTVDATPLFVLLFAETVAWSGDGALYRDLLPHVRRALEWCETHGDRDGDGLVEYQSRAADGVHIVHQGWKDSLDSLHHADGRPASGSIALVEVQGYLYAAYVRLADVAATCGDPDWAADLRGRADRLRRAVEERFWLEDQDCYAQALDGDGRPVAVVSSNAGHLLFCGLPSADRAARLAARFRQPDMDTGWGLRTLSATAPTYNPLSYHNGSVWPHDTSLVAAGLRRYGFAADAQRLIRALFDAAMTDPLARLPELYCGFARGEGPGDAPVAYPVSCSPQAWAAGAVPQSVATILDLRLDLEAGEALVDPDLPPWIDHLTVDRLSVNGQPARVEIRRQGADYLVDAEGPVRWANRVVAGTLSNPTPARAGAPGR